MTKAIQIHEHGGPEVLTLTDIEIGAPGPGQAKIRHEAIGLNFIDIYFRSGVYPVPAGGFPFIPGGEGAGVVLEVGPDVSNLKPGDRVAYSVQVGAYAEERLVPADRLVKIPDGINSKTAAAMMLKGLTAQYLLRQTFKVGPGHTILFHAAAGGVGLIATQWAKHLGATVIGTVGSQEKAELARAHGCDHVINYRTHNFAEEVARITGGAKCEVVYDSIGKDAFPGSLDSLKPLGCWVLFGQSSGPVPDLNMQMLAQKGSLFATRPTLFTYAAKREQLEAMAADLFDVVGSGAVKIEINQEFALADVAEAHRALAGRATTGTTILVP